MAEELEIVHVDVEAGLPPASAADRRLILWHGGAPVGSVEAPAVVGTGAALADAIAHKVAAAMEPQEAPHALLTMPLEPAPEPPAPVDVDVTVAIRSGGDNGRLERCRSALAAGTVQPARVIVVGGEARTAALGTGGDVIVFVDDVLEPHPRWLERLCGPFSDADVAAAAGPVLERGRVPVGHQPPALGRRWPGPASARATLAVRVEAVRSVGPWDERLAAPARDPELWERLRAARWTCREVPGAVAFHDGPLAEDPAGAAQASIERLLVAHARSGALRPLGRALLALPARHAYAAARRAGGRALSVTGAMPARPVAPPAAAVAGCAHGLRRLRLAAEPASPQGRAPLPAFLARNPFSHPFTEGFFYREKMRAIHRVAPEVAAREVLEVGGGRSGLARRLYPGAHVTTVDLDPEHASAPAYEDPLARFLVADATALPFPDASFDIVTMLDVLEHIPDDRAAAAEAWRVLRPGGHLIASSPNEHWRSPYHRVMAPICPDDAEMIARWAHVRRGYTIADYAALFGRPPDVRADFINRVTVVCHDLAFSHLPGRVRRGLCTVVAPATWLGYALQPRGARGTESAVSWRKPAA